MNRKELITQLLEGPMDDEVRIVPMDSADNDEDVSTKIVQVAETDEGTCYLYTDPAE